MPAELRKAMEKHRLAAESLIAATKAAYPVGSLLEVQLGKSSVVGKVISVHDSWWYSPGRLTIENVKTGKSRSFNATCESIFLIRKGEA